MATEAVPSDQLPTQTTEGISNPEPPEDSSIPATKPPPKKPAILTKCELCNVTLTSQSMIDAHMGSKKHKKKTQAAESTKGIPGQKKVATGNSTLYRCDVCNVSLNSIQQKEVHLAGMKHNYKLKKNAEANEMFQGEEIPNNVMKMNEAAAAVTNNAPQGTIVKTEAAPVQPTDLKCVVCNITVNSAQQLAQHLSSKKHQLKESSPSRPAPYYRPRGGLGLGASGESGSSGGPGGPGGPGGRGRGRGRGRGQGQAQGQGRWGAGPKPGGFNSLKSNFQSAGFTTNFQTPSHNQSLKRERSPRSNTSFGNGNNDDFSTNSYHQRGKIPRGPQSTPFYNQDSMDHNSFRSGNNSFGGGNNFSGGNKSFGGGSNSFGGGSNSFGGGNNSFGGGNNSFGGGSNSFGGGSNSYGGGSNSFGGADSFGNGNNSFGGGNSSFGGGNKSFSGGNDSYGGGNKSFGTGTSSFGAGNSSFDSGNSNFGNSNNSFGGGFGRGKMRGGPAKRGNSLKRGRGFGPQGGYGNATAAPGGGY